VFSKPIYIPCSGLEKNKLASERMKRFDRSMLAAGAPLAAAILTFGAIYGTAARSLADPVTVFLSSALIFSGALQFTTVGLLRAGAETGALIAAAVALNARHVLLGAVLRARLKSSATERTGLAWFLIDESAGLAMSASDPAATLLVVGLLCYSAWVGGTVIGILGGSIGPLRSAAEAVFPVLFVGLAALSCTSRSLAVRAFAAAALTVPLALAWPEGRGLAPVVAAIVVSIPGSAE
jgi:predicted branched-subunit amino acid permease